jgi:hypothetical protein
LQPAVSLIPPSDEDLSLGIPAFHPSDEDLSLGTPGFIGLGSRLRIAQPSESTFAYQTITDLQKSGGDLQLADSIGVPDGI